MKNPTKGLKKQTHDMIDGWMKGMYGEKYFRESDGGRHKPRR